MYSPRKIRNRTSSALASARALDARAFRPDSTGKPVPRDIITEFICKYNGEEIFRAELFPAIAANPFLTFFTVADETGTLNFEWSGDNGFTATQSVNIT